MKATTDTDEWTTATFPLLYNKSLLFFYNAFLYINEKWQIRIVHSNTVTIKEAVSLQKFNKSFVQYDLTSLLTSSCENININ